MQLVVGAAEQTSTQLPGREAELLMGSDTMLSLEQGLVALN
jgi:hypothetical protein